MAVTAQAAGVQIVTGDTKVVPRGQGGGLYLVTTGVGLRDTACKLGLGGIRAGDAILVSGPVGDAGRREAQGARRAGGDAQDDWRPCAREAGEQHETHGLELLARSRLARDGRFAARLA